MHLTIISPFPPSISGVGQYAYYLTQEIARSRVFSRITILTTGNPSKNGPIPEIETVGIEYCWRLDDLNSSRKILSRVKELAPDLVWLNLRTGMFGNSAASVITGMFTPYSIQQLGIPIVTTIHELVETMDLKKLDAPGGVFAYPVAKLITHLASHSDVVCLTMKSDLEWFLKNYPKTKTMHIPLGLYHDPLLMEEPKDPELLLFNMIAPFKGIELLIKGFIALKKSFPKIKLTIAGEEHPRYPGYASLLKNRYGDISGLKWQGKVADENIKDLFQGAQIVVLPYKASTGSSSVLFQSAGWGRPVVASNLPEIIEQVKENNLQVEIFETENSESLIQALKKLLLSPELRRSQAKNNLSAVSSLRIESTYLHYLKAFNAALELKKTGKQISILNTQMELE